jgi:hypothetical protein
MEHDVFLWLDDIRTAPPGWIHVRTDQEARAYLARGVVRRASLDHDLGACQSCLGGRSPERWLEEMQFQSMPNCEHFGTGYTLVCWMEETGHWPVEKPYVHSRNPAGRMKMQAAIDRRYATPEQT